MAGIDPDHPLAEHAYDEFLEEVDGVAGVVAEERGTPVAGEKGALTELVLVLMAPGAGSAVVNLIRLWLERDQKRSVEVAVTKPGEEPFTVRASGEKISLGLLEETVKAAVQGATGAGTTGQGPQDDTGQTGE
ncbi:hypothetical protein AQJ67_02170 [Streptomyces caeruleatus]|uniref:Uncharacterized protein n=1 Tax=Streptomyces caeruleatus TaxID=661399 RepID=A0A117RS52_9ACTN|nr:hypothetical protein AQJ67_02170 [Streptomyces caeruleatus]